jgi:tRNA 2-thiocytidine biosynthesis protein TtcA
MLRDWEKLHPGRVESIFNALSSVTPSHLLDRALHDFANLQVTPESQTTLPIRISK